MRHHEVHTVFFLQGDVSGGRLADNAWLIDLVVFHNADDNAIAG